MCCRESCRGPLVPYLRKSAPLGARHEPRLYCVVSSGNMVRKQWNRGYYSESRIEPPFLVDHCPSPGSGKVYPHASLRLRTGWSSRSDAAMPDLDLELPNLYSDSAGARPIAGNHNSQPEIFLRLLRHRDASLHMAIGSWLSAWWLSDPSPVHNLCSLARLR